MNRRLKKSRAIEYIILCYAVLLMILIGPVGILDTVRVEGGTEVISGQTQAVGENERIQQVFIADGGYLEKISIYAENDLSGKVINLSISDELGETVFSRNVALNAYEAPGYFTVPVEFQTVAGRAYVWQISHPEEEVVLAWQETAQSGVTYLGNYYYMTQDQQIQEQVGKNILMRFTYADPVSTAGKAGWLVLIAFAAGFLVLLVENAARSRRTPEKEVSMQMVARAVCNPLILVTAAAGLAAVWIFDYYGGVKADKEVYSAGILILAALLAYVVNRKRQAQTPAFPPLKETLLDKGMDALQALFWAGALWGCIDYVNAMYNIYQDYAYRKVLIYLGLVLLTMCEKKAVLHISSLAWIVLSATAGFFYWTTQRDVEEMGKLAQLDAILLVVGGLVVMQLVRILLGKKIKLQKLAIPYAAALLIFFVLLVLFRNTRGWPIYLVVAFGLLYIFYLAWDRKERFLTLLCNGIVLNFICELVFAVARRPFRAWFFYRYNFVFHTVTVTAAYLTLVLCALFVKLLAQYHRSRKLYTWWFTGLLFGMASSLLLLTLSRTGYLAAAAMGVVILLFVSLFCYRERPLYFIRKVGTLLLLLIACFPVTYSAVRLIPPLYDDPYLFELEENDEEWAIHKGDPADSENYITFPRFAYCFDTKLFGDEHSILRKFVDTFMADAEAAEGADMRPEPTVSGTDDGELAVLSLSWPLASAADTQDAFLPELTEVSAEVAAASDGAGNDGGQTQSGPAEAEEDYSNGRMEIFRRYIAQWNLTGHDIMGVELADGSLSVHAHNTYLQVIHDHGLITGAAYLLLGIFSLIQMFRYAWGNLRAGRKGEEETDAYAALPLAVFLAFAVAGLVEWLFHPCNPLGFTTMAVLAPLLTFKKKRELR